MFGFVLTRIDFECKWSSY